MPPVFKKPQEYNPQAAEQTLRSLKEGEERAQKKKQSMLAELVSALN